MCEYQAYYLEDKLENTELGNKMLNKKLEKLKYINEYFNWYDILLMWSLKIRNKVEGGEDINGPWNKKQNINAGLKK